MLASTCRHLCIGYGIVQLASSNCPMKSNESKSHPANLKCRNNPVTTCDTLLYVLFLYRVIILVDLTETRVCSSVNQMMDEQEIEERLAC